VPQHYNFSTTPQSQRKGAAVATNAAKRRLYCLIGENWLINDQYLIDDQFNDPSD